MHIHAEIIERCRQGDRDAHYELYKLYARSMYNIGYRIVHSEEEAEDVLQEQSKRYLERAVDVCSHWESGESGSGLGVGHANGNP